MDLKVGEIFRETKYRTAAVLVGLAFFVGSGLLVLRDVLRATKAEYVSYGEIHATLRAGSNFITALNLLHVSLACSGACSDIGAPTAIEQHAAAMSALQTLQSTEVTHYAVRAEPDLANHFRSLQKFIQGHQPDDSRLSDKTWITATLSDIKRQMPVAADLVDRISARANERWRQQLPDVQHTLRILTVLCIALGMILALGSFAFGFMYMRMRRRIEDANRSLAESQRATEAANKAIFAKNNFLAVIGHELRTPAQTLQASMQFLDLRWASRMDPVDHQAWDRLKSSVRQSEALMRDLTDFARLESGKMSLVRTVFNPADVLKKLVSNFQLAASRKGLHIVGDFKNTRTSILEDEHRFAQIASNLIVNAIKYSETGTITVKLYYTPGEKNIMRLAVEDNGPGIREEFRTRMFDPFTQDDQSLTRKHDGAGMGLAIVLGLVKLMGGKIKVANSPKGGARFTVKIPVDIAGESDAAPDSLPTEPSPPTVPFPMQVDSRPLHPRNPIPATTANTNNGKRILLVDDKAEVRDSIKLLLQHFGYWVDSVATGKEALSLVAMNTYAVIILDIQMPDMDGFDLAERIRNTHGPNFDVPLIAVSGFEESITAAMQRDIFTEYLMKPIGHEALIPLLEQLT